ncbi:hypothetical protein DPMN_002685 [Dreissena polymorpha]|uniref:Uncharacterized protein n=1 Tax=Dreissena polymorpha TaxID=45954 RepID=A0A9D4MNM4_DREPO|nr:hypothetical protein DPMN_002685 [Dreissena polymorpha]
MFDPGGAPRIDRIVIRDFECSFLWEENLGSLPPKWAGPWEADAYSHAACLTQGAPQGLVMRPCMVEIDRIVIRDFECLTGYCKPSWRAGGLCGLCIVVCQFQGSSAYGTDGGDNHNEPVNSQLTLPTKHKLYVSGCGAIYTNCIRNNKTLRV